MALRVLSIPAVAAILLLGLWLAAGVVTNDFRLSMALAVAWFAVAAAASLVVSRRWRPFRAPVVGTFLVTAVAVGAFLTWTTFRDTTANERLSTGPALASGSFKGLAHETAGRAVVVDHEGERKLTLRAFETDPGPDLFVYLVAGDDPADLGDNVRLGSLKGNKGNQQYAIPTELDLDRYRTVVIWCRAFSVAFGAAELRRAA